jgi:hypothetical protein
LRRVRIILAGLGHVVIHADVVDGSGGDRAGARQVRQSAAARSPRWGLASLGGVHHAALRGAVHQSCCPGAARDVADDLVPQLKTCGLRVLY